MTLEKIKKSAQSQIEKLDMPESIRTPGRTWTTYPDNILKEITKRDSIKPEIIIEGNAEAFTGEEAVQKAGEKLLNSIKPGENKLNAIHAANINSIIYIKAKKGESKAQIKHNVEEADLFSHLVLDCDNHSEVKITEDFQGENTVNTSFTEIYTGKNSNVNYGAIESIKNKLSYSRRKAITKRDTTIKWLNGQFNGQLNRTQIDTVLKGDNSNTEKIGVWYPVDDQHMDIALKAFHRGSNTKCDMDSRAVVDDEARSLYEGLQRVEQTADNTSSFQDQESLLLSNNAEADASPKLMIENPDVEASHAAAAGNIQQNQKHYLKSRGLNEEQSRRLVIKGYFEPVMEKITLPDLKKDIREEVHKKLNR